MKTQTFATLPDGMKVTILLISKSYATKLGPSPETAKVSRPLYNQLGEYMGESTFYVETSKLKY